MELQPYVFFDGRGEEAIEFYKKALGAEVNMLMRFKDMPASCGPNAIKPGTENKVMHAHLKIGDSHLLVSDGDCKGQSKHEGFSLTLQARNDAEADRAFSALSEGGTVRMPLQKTFFSSKFGMIQDRFGIPWMVIVEQ